MTAQRCAQILNGVVFNVILADPMTFHPGDGSLIVASDTAQIGWTYAGSVFTPVAPPAPPPQTTGLNFLQFMALFTPVEQASIAGSSDPQVKLFNLMATGAPQIDLTDARVAGGVNYLAMIGLITPARATTILAGIPPA